MRSPRGGECRASRFLDFALRGDFPAPNRAASRNGAGSKSRKCKRSYLLRPAEVRTGPPQGPGRKKWPPFHRAIAISLARGRPTRREESRDQSLAPPPPPGRPQCMRSMPEGHYRGPFHATTTRVIVNQRSELLDSNWLWHASTRIPGANPLRASRGGALEISPYFQEIRRVHPSLHPPGFDSEGTLTGKNPAMVGAKSV